MELQAPRHRPARESGRAEDSAFRRHWTWRERLLVRVAGGAIALVLRLVYATLRVRVVDPAGVVAAHRGGARMVFATWHDGIVLLPLAMLRVETRFRPRVMLSWHRDAEIAAQAVRPFGVQVIRGSSTRGWLGAIRGLLEAHARGEDLVVVPDGPKGPRHLAKDGVGQLARATQAPVVPIGLAAQPAVRLGSWDRLQIPVPFARVGFVFGPPVTPGADARATLAAVQEALAAAAGAAAAAAGVPDAGTAPASR